MEKGVDYIGGGLEFGETLEQAVAREVLEEYGFEIEVQELLDVVNHLIPGENQHWVSPAFICRIMGGTPLIREPHKCDEIPETKLTIASGTSLRSLRKKCKSR